MFSKITELLNPTAPIREDHRQSMSQRQNKRKKDNEATDALPDSTPDSDDVAVFSLAAIRSMLSQEAPQRKDLIEKLLWIEQQDVEGIPVMGDQPIVEAVENALIALHARKEESAS